ncbi:MAG: CRISPR-associated protein Csx15 [Anaerolineae bacterium]|nr:CRISPR-associated protein Csx15 [Anaerolineae bacterium]
MLLLNFSHPIPTDQLTRLEQLTGQTIARIIEIKTQIDPQAPLVPQIVALADACQLSPDEWQTAPLLIVPPSLNFVAVTLLAELHGRCGYFPAMVRTRPVEGALPPRYEIAEVINLQAVRDAARARR